MLESYALPGQLNIGSDSHTPHVGAIGCVAFGIGTTDVFNSWITKDVRVKVPESVKIIIRGKKRRERHRQRFHPEDSQRSITSAAARHWRRSWSMPARPSKHSSVDERATMTNMAAEIGGFTGIVAPDQKVVDFLVERRGMERERSRDADRRPLQRS